MEEDLSPNVQYWSMYVNMVECTGTSCEIKILPAMTDIFFGLNRPNYARWSVLFLNQLAKEAPQSQAVLQSGAFSIRCTEMNFSRSPIDLVLEQTAAASPVRDIIGFHYSPNAIRIWCITSSQRGMSVTELRRLAGFEII